MDLSQQQARDRASSSRRLPRRLSLAISVAALAATLAACQDGGGSKGESWFPSGPSAAQNGPSWSLNTWVRSGGGFMSSPNGPNQVVANGSVFSTQTTTGLIPVSATANPGYQINQVVVNGLIVATSGSTWSGTVTAGTTQSVWVAFTAIRYTLTASAGPGGRVTPTSLTMLYIGNTAKVTFQPISGWRVASITVTGASAVACAPGPCSGPWVANAAVAVTSTIGTANVTVTATFAGNPTANAGAGQVVPPGRLVTLDGTGTIATVPTVSSFSWVQTQNYPVMPAVALTSVGASATFTAPTTEGTYYFTLTVQPGGSTAQTSVVVTTDPVGAAQTQCNACHASAGVGASTNVFGKWSASQHASQYVMCFSCHVGSNTGGHPGDLSQTTVSATTFTWNFTTRGYPAGSNFCATCHETAAQNVADFQASVHSSAPGGPGTCSGCHGDAHEAASGTARCAACHAPGGTVAGHPFPMDGTTACTTCHNPHTAAAMPAGGHDTHIKNGIGCSTCHVHIIGVVEFDPAGPAWSAALPPPSFDSTAKTCSSVACHSIPAGEFSFWFPGGDGSPEPVTAAYGGSTTTPSWYSTPTGGCTACHDLTAQGGRYAWHSGSHGATVSGGNSCQLCHPDATGTVTASGPGADVALSTASRCGPSGTAPCASLHRNGVLDVEPRFKPACFGCH